MNGLRHIAVIGGSIAGATAAGALRTGGFEGTVTLFTAEPHPPYTRPPLSKDILTGAKGPDSAVLDLQNDITVRTRMRAVALDARHRRIEFANGQRLGFDGIVLATGARARRIADRPDITEHVLRSIDDAARLREAIHSAASLTVVGGGPLGMEIASACVQQEKAVTIVDPQPVMRQQVGEFLARVIRRAAEDAGVDFLRPSRAVRLDSQAGGGAAVIVDGVRIESDLVITAAGDLPNVEWLDGSGLHIDGGVVVDSHLRAAPGIVAAGDVVRHRVADGLCRTPLWTSAREQATAAASTLLDGSAAHPYRHRPYFWTEQFGLSIKACGTVPTSQPPRILEGSEDDLSLVLQWQQNGIPVAAATVNKRMPIVRLRRLAQETPPTLPKSRSHHEHPKNCHLWRPDHHHGPGGR